MTELLINHPERGWQRAFFSTEGGAFRLTRENPYFNGSGAYTLDVTIPMAIAENRLLFGGLHRKDCGKKTFSLPCRLMVAGALALSGTASLTQVTEKELKLQLTGGRSEVSCLSEADGDYVDMLPLGTVSGRAAVSTGIASATTPFTDETRGAAGVFRQFQLIGLVRQVLAHYGFSVTRCDIDREPWNRVFVALPKATREVSHVLPHWTPRELLTEFCHFFNVVTVIDEPSRSVSFVSPGEQLFSRAPVSLDVADEYQAELESGEVHTLATDNLSFALSSSPGHDYDCVPDSLRLLDSTVSYDSYSDLFSAYQAMSEKEQRRHVLRCPEGRYTGWTHQFYYGTPWQALTQIDVFAPLTRASDAGETSLKICPVAMQWAEMRTTFGLGDGGGRSYTSRVIAPTAENPSGSDSMVRISLTGETYGGTAAEDEGEDIQDLIEGSGADSGGEKEDLLQVMFIDDRPQTYYTEDSETGSLTPHTTSVGFTDWQYKQNAGDVHRRWSFSLCQTRADHWLGQLHQNGFSLDLNVRHTFKFLASQMPDPTCLFLIRGHRYVCEKIEAGVTAEGFDRLMTGYFYEITS